MRGRDPNNPRRWRDEDERRSGSEDEWRDEWRPAENRWREGQGTSGSNTGYGYGNYGSAGGYEGYGSYDRRFNRQDDPDDWQSRVDWHGRNRGGFQGGRENRGGYFEGRENRGGYEGRENRHEDRGLLERAGDWLQRTLGKAPKGYTRSDDRIREDLSDQIWRRSDIDASDVEIVVKNGEVTLVGNVSERRTKRALEDLAEECLGVVDVHNQIKVNREAQNGGRERSSSTSTSNLGTTSTTTSTTKTPRA